MPENARPLKFLGHENSPRAGRIARNLTEAPVTAEREGRLVEAGMKLKDPRPK
jgi:hypothetical protein